MTAIVGIGGGIGASRLWRVLAAATDPAAITLIVNTADDIWRHGLRVCPDLDTTLYALSGRQDAERGWGLRDETFRCMDELRGLGEDVWFNLGDRDLATHLRRTGLLRAGAPLSEVTAQLGAAMGVGVRVLPMTDDEVATTVVTADDRRLHYEEYLVREQAAPAVQEVVYDGAAGAAPGPGVLDAIAAADVVLLAPSSPPASIGPVLAVPGVREALATTAAPVVAVSPIVSRVPIADPGDRGRAQARAALLRAGGVEPTATGVAGLYRDVCDRFVVDRADAEEADAIRALGLDVAAVPTLVHLGAPTDELLDALLTIPAEAPWT